MSVTVTIKETMRNIAAIFRVPSRKFSRGVPKSSCSILDRPVYGPMEVQRSEQNNGMKIAAAKSFGSQICSCTVMFQAGSRYECGDYIGASHFIRACTSAPGDGCTAFSKMRILQHNGAYLTCTGDRQSLAFTLRCTLPMFSEFKYYLLDTAARCWYKDWVIDDRRPLIRDENHRISPAQRVIDLVQKALWRGPLSNSIYCEDTRVDEMSEDRLGCFANINMRSNYCTVASYGVPFDETMKLADNLEPKPDKAPERQFIQSYPRKGFECYDLGRDADTWIAVAVPGCGTSDINILAKYAIVAAACGSSSMLSGQHALDRTSQPPLGLMSGKDIFTEYRAFNISYKDSGTFGILAKTRACCAKQVACSAAEFLSHVGDLDFKQIETGRRRLKLSLLTHYEDCTKVTEALALQLANNVQLDSPKQVLCLLNMINTDTICLTAKAISAKSKQMALAVVGDVDAAPNDVDLFN